MHCTMYNQWAQKASTKFSGTESHRYFQQDIRQYSVHNYVRWTTIKCTCLHWNWCHENTMYICTLELLTMALKLNWLDMQSCARRRSRSCDTNLNQYVGIGTVKKISLLNSTQLYSCCFPSTVLWQQEPWATHFSANIHCKEKELK